MKDHELSDYTSEESQDHNTMLMISSIELSNCSYRMPPTYQAAWDLVVLHRP